MTSGGNRRLFRRLARFVLPWLWGGLLLAPACSATAVPGADNFDRNRAWSHLEAQCAFGPRYAGSPGYAKCLDYLQRTLQAEADAARAAQGTAARVQRQGFTAQVAGKPVAFANILAHFPSALQQPKGRILLCAHWDTRPRADEEQDPARQGSPILGANDGASGVAVLLEVARLLAARPCPYTVTIALFDGEDFALEPSEMLAGSRAYAAAPWPAKPEWGVLLDMVGDADLRLPQEAHSLARATDVVERLWAAAARAGCPAFVRSRGVSVVDDHWPLIEAGIPTADVIDFAYPAWHTLGDTPRRCSRDSLAQVGRALQEMLWGGG